jgi:hypothetical protein
MAEEARVEELEAKDREIFMSERREDIGALIVAGLTIVIVLILVAAGYSPKELSALVKAPAHILA